jgi:type I restriction enzyme M protein
MSNYQTIANTIWNSAEILHFQFNKTEYKDVILPFTVLKRLDTVLEPTKDKVIERFNELDGRVENLSMLTRITGYKFYNTSPYTFKKLLDNPTHLVKNFKTYLHGYSPNIQEILNKMEFDRVLRKISSSNQLYLLIKEFEGINLHPDVVSNHDMGLAFEELIRKFSESSNEEAGEHYTPRDVVRLMTSLVFVGEEELLKESGVVRTLYDPACGTGGMLTVGKNYIQANFNKDALIYLYGQEINGKTYAICKSDMLLKGDDPEKIKGGEDDQDEASTLSNDQHAGMQFDYIISNPPYGVDWKKDKEAVQKDFDKGESGRFYPGLPRVSDGQFLFIEHIVSKFKSPKEGGSEAAVITNGSPLFTGDAGQGESEIRRWILENDYLDALIALPGDLFFNTGIGTYIWILSNKKAVERKNKVMLIDAREMKTSLRKNLGSKRYEISDEHREKILELYKTYKESKLVKIFDTTQFAYRKITIERAFQQSFKVDEDRLQRFQAEKAYINLAESKSNDPVKAEKEIEEGEKLQAEIIKILQSLPNKTWTHPKPFIDRVVKAFDVAGIELYSPLKNAIKKAFGEYDENAEVVKKSNGEMEPDSDLRDYEYVPYGEDVIEYFKREVEPYVNNAWINKSVVDNKDGEVGKVGYEINFTRYFYEYKPPRPLEEIDAEITELEVEIGELFKELKS